MKASNLFLFILYFPAALTGQSLRDSVLQNERSIDRAITLHRGQLRIEGGYMLSTITSRFDADGTRIKLRDEGLSYVRHQFQFDLRYGVFDNLTFSASTNYKKQAIRKEQIITYSTVEGIFEISEVEATRGFENILLSLQARAPFTSKKLDLIAIGGLLVPLGKGENLQPEHELTEEDDGYAIIHYNYTRKWGYDAFAVIAGGLAKYRLNNAAVTVLATYEHPLAESVGTRWQHQRNEDEFSYRSEEYSYQQPNLLKYGMEIEYQFAPWVAASMMVVGENSKGGWEEINGLNYRSKEISTLSISPGYEILVTPKIWLRQRAYISLLGKEAEAPFSFFTSLVYNFFPFSN